MRFKYFRNATRLSLLFAAAVGTSSQTATADDLGFFIGADFGRARMHTEVSRYEGQLVSQADSFGDLIFTTSSLHSRTNSWWTDAGFLFWPNFGVDAMFLHLGELTNRNTGMYTPAGGSAEPVVAITKLRSTGPVLAALLRLPLMPSLSLDVRVGDYLARTTSVNGVDVTSYTVTSQSTRDSSLLVGIGATYNFAGPWSAKLDYVRIEKAGNSKTIGTYNADLASVGISYTF